MKKISLILLLVALVFACCRQKEEIKSPDLNAAKAEVTDLMEKFHNASVSKDIAVIQALFADEGLFCGTDPSELMDKKAILAIMTQAFADTSVNMNYVADKREIRLASDGNAAVVLEQVTIPPFAPKIPMRMIYHAVRTNDAWIFDFVSWNFIPLNEDIARLNKALE